MSIKVSWDPDAEQPPARLAAWRSMNLVSQGRKEEWLDLFAADAVVADPVGPSMFDPEGAGHRGRDGIAGFWEKAIAPVQQFDFDWRESHAAGSEVANVGTITTHLAGGYVVDTSLVAVYRVDDEGKIVSMRAFWEPDRAASTLRKVSEPASREG
jgi:steroid Delta-isomerase